jgi:hypothetical protein
VEEEYKNAGKFSRSDNVTGIKSSTEIEKFLFSATQNLARRAAKQDSNKGTGWKATRKPRRKKKV